MTIITDGSDTTIEFATVWRLGVVVFCVSLSVPAIMAAIPSLRACGFGDWDRDSHLQSPPLTPQLHGGMA